MSIKPKKQADVIPMLRPRVGDALKFLRQWRPQGPWLLVALVADRDDKDWKKKAIARSCKSMQEAEDFILKHNVARDGLEARGIYFSVNPTKRTMDKKPRKADIASAEFLHVDADPQEGESPAQCWERLQPVIADYYRRPSLVTISGNGVHLLWRLAEPVILDSDKVIAEVEERNKALAEDFGTDPVTRNIDRVLRVPGTVNYPNAKKRGLGRVPVLAKMVESNDVSYDLDDFVDHYQAHADEVTQRVELDESGSGFGFRFMRDCRRKGMSYEQACAAIHDDDGEAGEWASRCGERQLKRAYERSADKSEDKQEEKAPPKLQAFFLEQLQEREVVPLEWICEDFILAGKLNAFFGEGATGKDYLLLQLGIAMTCGARWLGRKVKQGRVLYFPVEEDSDDLRRREDHITRYYAGEGIYRPVPQRFKIVPLEAETVLAKFDSRAGLVRPTPLYTSVCLEIEKFKPTLVILGNRVNIFSVNQNDDAHAVQCLHLLRGICREYGTTVIMPGHVSMTGREDGTSGSVQWSNGARHRLYLRRVKGDKDEPEPDPNLRELEVMKTNWAATGKTITMRFCDGLFQADIVEVEGEPEVDELLEDENTVLRLFDKLVRGAHVSPELNAPNNIVTKFKTHHRFKRRGKVKLEEAIERLYAKGILDTGVTDGPPSRRRPCVVRKG